MTLSILDLALSDVGELKRVANTSGGEYVGPCPDCGGVDRFHVWPMAGRFWCRQCGASGGTVKYLTTFHGLSSAEASAAVDDGFTPRRRHRRPARDLAPTAPPSLTWQGRARAFVESGARTLWAPAGRHALDYLRGRGLTDASIKAARIGYNTSDSWLQPSLFGFPDEINPKTGKPSRVWLPKGLTIPAEVDGVLWYLKVRRLPTDMLRCPKCKAQRQGPGPCAQCGSDLPRYVMLRGSVPALFGADTVSTKDAMVFVGGELDALLLRQQAGDLAGVVTWGSESGLARLEQLRPFVSDLLPVFDRPNPLALAALDDDDAGRNGTATLMTISKHIQPAYLPIVEGCKDITDWHLAGVDLRAWLAGELDRDRSAPAPMAKRAASDLSVGELEAALIARGILAQPDARTGPKPDETASVARPFRPVARPHDGADIPASIREFAAEVGAVVEVLP